MKPIKKPANALRYTEEKRAQSRAFLQARLKKALTDDEDIRRADSDFNELLRALGQNRHDSGERPLFPDYGQDIS